MGSVIDKDYIICGSCRLKFERTKEYKHCSNCFACTGCEIYYCPHCDEEIIITPVRSISSDPMPNDKTTRERKTSET